MKLNKTQNGIVIEKDNSYYPLKEETWDSFVNDDHLYEKMEKVSSNVSADPRGESLIGELLAPLESQEIWASGVTYFRSREGRQEESKGSGGGDFYARVYEAERPELQRMQFSVWKHVDDRDRYCSW